MRAGVYCHLGRFSACVSYSGALEQVEVDEKGHVEAEVRTTAAVLVDD